MKIDKATAEKINKKYEELGRLRDFDLKVSSDFHACISEWTRNFGSEMVKLEKLTELIKSLETMREAIREVTGIEF